MGGGFVQRGFAELRPRRINHFKIATTLVRQMQFLQPEFVDNSTLLMPLNATEVRDIQRHLIDIKNLRLGPPSLPEFMHAITQEKNGQIIAAISDSDRPRHDAHSTFARVIHAQHPRLENKLAKSMVESLLKSKGYFDSQANERRKLVIEERPGKALLLDLSDLSWRSAIKRLQILANRELGATTNSSLETPEGWGLAALRINPVSQAKDSSIHRKIRIACLTLRMPGDDINLDTGNKLREIVDQWIRDTFRICIRDLKRLVISDPWLVIANFVAEPFCEIASSCAITYPDTVFGWQPVITAMEFCMGLEVPAVAIFTGSYPDVHIMAVST